MKSVKISVIVPAYNEEKAITSTINRLKKTMAGVKDSSEIIVVNDGSKDNTAQILKKTTGIRAISHKVNMGYGASLKTGIMNARGDWIVITDSDGTYPIEDIPKLLQYTDEFDMVIGARTGKHVKIPTARRPAKWLLRKVVKVLTKVDVPDLNSGLRVFKKEMAMRFWNLFPDGFSFTTTITVASLSNRYKLKYIPINYYERKGKSTIHPIRDFVGFNMLIMRIVTYFNPLAIFIPVSLIAILIGIAKGVFDFLINNRIGTFAMLMVVFGLQVFFFGMLADLVNKRLERNVWNKRI